MLSHKPIMSSDTSGLPDNLRHKFPEMRPVKSAPTLMRINGIGVGMYGKRDLDPETRTYIKTQCFCVVFVPLIALAAYRVADAERGWYFIGKERLSSFAKSWNLGILILSLMFAGILAEQAHKSSPEYVAKQELKRADEAMKSGRVLPAADVYRELALGTTAQAPAARRGLGEAIEQCLREASPEKAEAAFKILATLPPQLNSPAPLVPDAYQRGVALIEKFGATNPDGTIGLLRQVALLNGSTNSLRPLEIKLLKEAIAAKANNTNRVVELALIYEEQKQLDLSYEVLSPYRHELGATEGARLLGQHLLAQGHYEDSYGLLYPYVQARLEKLRAVERNYTNTVGTFYRQCFRELNQGHADRSFYDTYKAASKAQKEELVDGYIQKRMESDPGFKRALAEFTAANKIVHVTLDLGMVQLNRAQNLADPGARKTELEAAEKTFLAIRGLAGGTDEYRLFLGQVYYWLGKSQEGGDLFTQLLEAHQRAYLWLMRLANTLREVGEENHARELTEEAYRTGKAGTEKFDAASMRARMEKDNDDQIAWLEKADSNDPGIQVALNNSRGRKAMIAGNRDLAAQYLRKSVEGFKNLPQTPAMLNNFGIAYLDLYFATGDIANHNRGLALLEQAVALSPGDSLLLNNITHLLITRAYMDVIGDSIHFAALKETPGHTMLAHRYKNEEERAQVIAQLHQNEYMKKALVYLDKALLLAPKNPALYEIGLSLQESFRDLGELQKLEQRIRVAAPDLAEIKRGTHEAYDSAKDKEHLQRMEAEIRRYQALMAAPAVLEHPATLEFAHVILNEYQQGAGILGAPADSQKLVAEALATYKSRPNSAALSMLTAAYFFRAHEQLKQQNPTYAELAARTRHAVSPIELIAFLLDRNDPMASMIRQNPSFLKGLEMLKEDGRLFPSFRQPYEWALFRTIEPNEAALVCRQLKADKVACLGDALHFQLNPILGNAVLTQYWRARINGNEAAAAALYQQALRDGVPLPAL